MNKPRFSVVTFVVCALSFTSVALIKYGAHQLRGQPTPAPATTTVLVAKKDIPAFTQVARHPEDYFEQREIPLGEDAKSSVRTFDELSGMQLRKRVLAEATLRKDDLWDRERERKELEVTLKIGERATPIAVDPESFADRSVWPSCRVDVVVDHDGKRFVCCRGCLLVDVEPHPHYERSDVFEYWVAKIGVTEDQCTRLKIGVALGHLTLVPTSPAE
jgi:Flp pilus assembly protein CpaB